MLNSLTISRFHWSFSFSERTMNAMDVQTAKQKENMPESKQSTESLPISIEYSKIEDFKNEYANNVFLESSAWDLKLNFGQFDQSRGTNAVVQYLGVTLPWPQVKMLIYFLRLHLDVQEINNGHVSVPKNVIPQIPAPSKETIKQNPDAKKIFEAISKLYNEFVSMNPETVPEIREDR